MSDWSGETDFELVDEWNDDDGETLTHQCPSCGLDVYDDVEQCPGCGVWITMEHSAWEGKPAWWIVLGLLGVIATIWALAGL